MWNNKVPKLVRESEGRLNERLALAAAGSCCKVSNSNSVILVHKQVKGPV